MIEGIVPVTTTNPVFDAAPPAPHLPTDRMRRASAYTASLNQPEDRTMKQWKARIKLANGNQQVVYVQANSQLNAKYMLEAQYGKGSIIGVPTPA